MFTNPTANRANLSYSQLLPNTTPLLFRPLLFVDSWQSPYSKTTQFHNAGRLKSEHQSVRSPSLAPDLSLYPTFTRPSRHAQADTSLDCRPRRFSLCPLGAHNLSHWLACSNLADGEPISYADSCYAEYIYIYIYIYVINLFNVTAILQIKQYTQ